MPEYLLVTASVTFALKARDVLRKNGFKATVEKSVLPDKSLGCGYAVAVTGNLEKAEKLLKNERIKILKVIKK